MSPELASHESESEVIALARRLARERLAPLAHRWDRTAEFPNESIAAIREHGLLGLVIPRNAGGGGADLYLTCRVIEELGAGCTSTALIVAMHWMSLLYLGPWCVPIEPPDEQRALDRLRGEVYAAVRDRGALVANCYGEPGSGANIPLAFTQAKPDPLGWRLSGRKFGTLAQAAQFIQTHAVVSDGLGRGQIVQFVLPTDLPGVRFEPFARMVGVRAAAPVRVVFEDCVVPDTYRFGTVGMFERANRYAPYATLLLCAPYLGLARAALEYAGAHLKARVIQGLNTTLVALPHVSDRFGELIVQYEAARSVVYRAAQDACFDPPQELRMLVEAAKVSVGGMVAGVAADALRLCGTRMLMETSPLERFVRDSLAAALHPPTAPEARAMLARLFLGLDDAPVGTARPEAAGALPSDTLPRDGGSGGESGTGSA